MTVGIEFFLGLFVGCYLYFQGKNAVSALQKKVQKERVYKQRHDAIDEIVTKAEEARNWTQRQCL